MKLKSKEDALCTWITRTVESLKEHSRTLRPLSVVERVFLQNQQGANPTKWDKLGFVVEAPDHDQYRVKLERSDRLTLRNRRILRAYTAANPSIEQRPRAQQQPPSREVEETQDSPRYPPRAKTAPLDEPDILPGEITFPIQTRRLHLEANLQVLLPYVHQGF